MPPVLPSHPSHECGGQSVPSKLGAEDGTDGFGAWILQMTSSRADTLLLLLIFAISVGRSTDSVEVGDASVSSPLPVSIWAVLALSFAASSQGKVNTALELRESGNDNLVFSALLGPLIAYSYVDIHSCQAEQLWRAYGFNVNLVALGSLQAILDLAVLGKNYCIHALQLSFFICAVWGTMQIFPSNSASSTSSALQDAIPYAVFLVVQKLTLMGCCRKGACGRNFSQAEGLFWAQAAATICTAMSQGILAGFPDWSTMQVFSGCLVIFQLVFLFTTLALHHVLIQHGEAWAGWAPVGALALALLVGLAWLQQGSVAWVQTPSEGERTSTPLQWFAEELSHPDHLVLLGVQWPMLMIFGIGAIDGAARNSPSLRGSVDSVEGGQANAKHLPQRAVKVLFRKAFHVLACALFIPPLLQGKQAFLAFSMLVAALLLITLETCRVCRMPWLADHLDSFMGRYLDKREDVSRGDLVLTHLYLLIGCALPLWLELDVRHDQTSSQRSAEILLRQASGILLVGIGDACSAVVGICLGKTRWPLSHRTLEGSSAFFLGVCSVALLLSVSVGADRWHSTGNTPWPVAFIGAALLTTLFEVYTSSIDNLTLPLYFCPAIWILSGRA